MKTTVMVLELPPLEMRDLVGTLVREWVAQGKQETEEELAERVVQAMADRWKVWR